MVASSQIAALRVGRSSSWINRIACPFPVSRTGLCSRPHPCGLDPVDPSQSENSSALSSPLQARFLCDSSHSIRISAKVSLVDRPPATGVSQRDSQTARVGPVSEPKPGSIHPRLCTLPCLAAPPDYRFQTSSLLFLSDHHCSPSNPSLDWP